MTGRSVRALWTREALERELSKSADSAAQQETEKTMNGTTDENKQEAFEDIPIEVPDTTEYETIPAGIYNARLVGLKVEPKPDWKRTGQEGENPDQIHWTFQIIEGEYEGLKLSDYTNITFHPKATAHKHAAALLGVPELTPGIAMSTGQLAGKTCQLWVIEKVNSKGQQRNYVDKVTPTPAPRMRPAQKQGQAAPAVGRVQVPGLPVDDADDDIQF